MIVLTGASGNKKLELAKYALKYYFVRNRLMDGIYEIETSTRNNKQGFLSQFVDLLRLRINHQ